jgi:AraC family L-rhamnose operon regulatory protein RhaS
MIACPAGIREDFETMPGVIPLFDPKSGEQKPDDCQPLKQAVLAGELHCVGLARGDYPGSPLPCDYLEGLRSIGYWDAQRPQRWGLDWHCNEGLELTFLEHGSCAFATGPRSYRLRPGDLTVTRPWQPHRVGDPLVDASRLHWLIVDLGVRRPNMEWRWPDWVVLAPRDRARLTTILRQYERPVLHPGAKMERYFRNLAEILAEPGRPGAFSLLAARINELLAVLLGFLEHSGVELDAHLVSSERTVSLFLQELRENARQRARPWSVGMMAEACGLSANRFTQICRHLTNQAPARYLMACRIEAAAAWLRSTDRSITEISLECGFSSTQYFAHAFRRFHDVSPREFREKNAG